MKDQIRNAYDLMGEKYYSDRKNKKGGSHFYNENLEMPTTLEFLGNVRGKKVLDLGCGPGLYANLLINKGAKYQGIDLSENLIEIARKEAPMADFKIGDVESLPYENEEFDIVFASLVIGHLSSWKKVLCEVRRVSKKNGLFIFSVYNPVADSFVEKKWVFRKFRVVKNYFKEDWKKGLWLDKGRKAGIVHHHKTYGTIVKLIVNNGFEIIDYEDCKPSEVSRELYPSLYKKFYEMPYFCVWKVRKK